METFCFVRPEHLSHQGFLFGGQLLKWVDEYTWLVAALDYPKSTLVTRAMDAIQFTKRVENGSILKFDISLFKEGSTSVSYFVKVYSRDLERDCEEEVFSTHITFVSVDLKGHKCTLTKRKNSV